MLTTYKCEVHVQQTMGAIIFPDHPYIVVPVVTSIFLSEDIMSIVFTMHVVFRDITPKAC